jgi:hypothetical protein
MMSGVLGFGVFCVAGAFGVKSLALLQDLLGQQLIRFYSLLLWKRPLLCLLSGTSRACCRSPVQCAAASCTCS